MTDTLSPAGSSSYDSNTMVVGDGTWDSSRNDFLLPNLVGLNFATMQYNGMGNRFRGLPEYHTLIIGHGAVAAITFLLIIPSAIFIARFYFRNPRLALRLHIYLQILTVFLSTVVLILGWFAVGPERSLTNPHHGIGVAIYVLIIVQALGGGLIHRIEKGKQRWRVPLKLVLHQWLGRAIALLGVAQVPLGLTLYGSPKVLFALYAVAVFLWALLYFVLTYIYQPTTYEDGSDYGSYISGPSGRTGPTRTEISEDRRSRPEGHGLRNTALFGAGLAGLAALRRKSRNRREEEDVRRVDKTRRNDYPRNDQGGVTRRDRRSGSRHTSGSYVEEEKLENRQDGQRHTWRDRLLGAGAGLAAYEGAKRFFNRRRGQHDEEDVDPYSAAPLGGNQSISRTDISRVQAGQAPFSPGDRPLGGRTEQVQTAAVISPTRRPLRQRRSRQSFDSYDSQDSQDEGAYGQSSRPDGRRRIAETFAEVSGLAYLREKQRERRERKEERRLDAMRQHDMENAERINRVNSNRNRRRFGADEEESLGTETIMTGPGHDAAITGSNPALSRHHLPNTNAPPLPASAYALPPGSNRQSVTENTVYNTGSEGAPMSGPSYPTAPGALNMPTGPVEHDPSRIVQSDTSNHYGRDAAAAALAAGAGTALANDARRRDRSRVRFGRRNSETVGEEGPASFASPPVSVKVKINNDGRQVTLRRLNEEEAAADRAARRQERRSRRRRAESLSSGVEDEGSRFRRNDAVRPVADVPISNIPRPPIIPNRSDELNLPSAPARPPPVPMHSSPQGAGAPSQVNTSAVTSPGYDTGTGTEMSAFDDNRRRRRAERAAAKQRAAQQGSRVNFA